jgi:hypothetical protein
MAQEALASFWRQPVGEHSEIAHWLTDSTEGRKSGERLTRHAWQQS